MIKTEAGSRNVNGQAGSPKQDIKDQALSQSTTTLDYEVDGMEIVKEKSCKSHAVITDETEIIDLSP
jgi:hypothetical protein